MNKITLIGSVRSPFVRICRMFMMKHNIPFEFDAINFVDDPKDAEQLAKKTPINRVPILVLNGQNIFDSRVIMNQLIKTYNLPELSIDDENKISSIYSCIDTGVALFLMKKDKFNTDDSGFFMTRHRQRIPENLKYLEDWAKNLNPNKSWSFAEMALFSFLYWADKRDLMKLSNHPVYQNFLKQYESLPEVVATGF